MRQTFGCGHKNTQLVLNTAAKIMHYGCEDCGITIIEGPVTTFTYKKDIPDDFNNPFLTGIH